MIVAIGFAALYALVLVPAVSNLVALPAFYDALGIGGATPWALLVIGVMLPVVIYTLGLLLGWRRPTGDRAILFAVGLAVTWALTFSLVSLVAALQPALL